MLLKWLLIGARLLVKAVAIILILFVTFLSFLYVMGITDQRYSFEEMDLNNDGVIGFSEASYVSESGTREITENGMKCVEYFAYKDGLPLKVVCDK